MQKEVIFILLVTWFVTKFEPLQMAAMNTLKAKNLVSYWIRSLFTCWFCLALWGSGVYLYQIGHPFKEVVFYSLVNSFAAWFITNLTFKK